MGRTVGEASPEKAEAIGEVQDPAEMEGARARGREGRRRGRPGKDGEEKEGRAAGRPGDSSVAKAALGRHEDERRSVLEGVRAGVQDNLWSIWAEPKEPNEILGKPFGPLGSILG